MTRINLKLWLGSNDDAKDNGILGLLHAVETTFIRMTKGIPLFLLETMPDFWRMLYRWLCRQLQLAIRVLIRLVRVTAAILLWMTIVFGPLALLTGILSGCWTILAIVASIWGLRREQRKRALAIQQAEI